MTSNAPYRHTCGHVCDLVFCFLSATCLLLPKPVRKSDNKCQNKNREGRKEQKVVDFLLGDREQLWLKEEPEKKEMAVSAVRGGRIPVVSFFYHRHRHPQFLSTDKENSLRLRKLNTRRSKRFPLFARYSQAQDLFSSRRLQGTPPIPHHYNSEFSLLRVEFLS